MTAGRVVETTAGDGGLATRSEDKPQPALPHKGGREGRDRARLGLVDGRRAQVSPTNATEEGQVSRSTAPHRVRPMCEQRRGPT